MSIEFIDTPYLKDIALYVSQIERKDEWGDILLARESIARLIKIRGRLLGERANDTKDLLFDINSFRGLNWDKERTSRILRAMVTIESLYYRYAENFAVHCAVSEDLYDHLEDFKDEAKNLVGWVIWSLWAQQGSEEENGLHSKVVGSMNFLSKKVFGKHLVQLSLSELFDETEGMYDRRIDPCDRSFEKPTTRLRGALSDIELEEVFRRLPRLSTRERLSLLCVMGYLPGVGGLTQGCKKFKVDPETFRSWFNSAIDRIIKVRGVDGCDINARRIVEESLKRGVIHDPNGSSTPLNSPRLLLLEFSCSQGLGEINSKIFERAVQLEGDSFRYSLTEIGEMVGGFSKVAVSKRIKRMVGRLETTT